MGKNPKHTAANLGPEITYIVSAFNRPVMLPVCLWSIKGQTHGNFEVIVTDNSKDRKIISLHKLAVSQLKDRRFKYLHTANKIRVSDCYWSAEYACKSAKGQWLCFPCDDSYLVPDFGRRMLLAGYSNDWDMVICGDVTVGPECNGGIGYKLWKMVPGKATKTTFIVRSSIFPGFTGKLNTHGAVLADYHLSGQIENVGILSDQLMVVHN